MIPINEIPTPILDKIKELALKEYNVTTVAELKSAIVDKEFERIVNGYLSEITKRILRSKADEARVYEPTNVEFIEKLQSKIDIASMDIEIT